MQIADTTTETYTDEQRTAARLQMITVGHTTTVYGISVTRWDNNRWEIGTFRRSPALDLEMAAEDLTDRWMNEAAKLTWNAIRWGGKPTISRAVLAAYVTSHALAAGRQITISPIEGSEDAAYSLVEA